MWAPPGEGAAAAPLRFYTGEKNARGSGFQGLLLSCRVGGLAAPDDHRLFTLWRFISVWLFPQSAGADQTAEPGASRRSNAEPPAGHGLQVSRGALLSSIRAAG